MKKLKNNYTENQEAIIKSENKKLRHLIEREGYTSAMNETKWTKLVNLMMSLKEKTPKYIAFCLDEDRSKKYWEYDWYHIPLSKFIKHLDIDPIQKTNQEEIDNTKLLTSLLKQNNIPFLIEGKFIRIYGYIKNVKI